MIDNDNNAKTNLRFMTLTLFRGVPSPKSERALIFPYHAVLR